MDPDKTLMQFLREMDVEVTLEELREPEPAPPGTKIRLFNPETGEVRVGITDGGPLPSYMKLPPGRFENYSLGNPVPLEILKTLFERFFEAVPVYGNSAIDDRKALCYGEGAAMTVVIVTVDPTELVTSLFVIFPADPTLD